MRKTIRLEKIEIEYFKWGSGKECLLAFHGFEGQAQDFEILEPSLGKRYTVIAVNLPFHGSSFPEASVDDYLLDSAELKNLISRILLEENFTRFSLLGYSLGGRVALQSLLLFPEMVNDLILMAPDGIRLNFIYKYSTTSRTGNQLFRRIIRNPDRFLSISRVMNRSGLMHTKEFNFINSQLSTEERRKKIWNVWMSHRALQPSLKEVAGCIQRNHINLLMIFGKYDAIIPPRVGRKLQSLVPESKIHVVEMGHNFFKEKMNEELDRIFESIRSDKAAGSK